MQNGQVCTWMRPQDNQRPPVATKVRIVGDAGYRTSYVLGEETSPRTYPPAERQIEIEVLESGEQATVAVSELFDCNSEV